MQSNRAQIPNCLNSKYLLKEKQENIKNRINLNCEFTSYFKTNGFLSVLPKINKIEVILATLQYSCVAF